MADARARALQALEEAIPPHLRSNRHGESFMGERYETIRQALTHTGFDPEMGFILESANAGELEAYDQACAEGMDALRRVLDGEDTGTGLSNDPWESLRRRVLDLMAAAK